MKHAGAHLLAIYLKRLGRLLSVWEAARCAASSSVSSQSKTENIPSVPNKKEAELATD